MLFVSRSVAVRLILVIATIAGAGVDHADASELSEQELVQAGELCRSVGSMQASQWQRQMESVGFMQPPDQEVAYLDAWVAMNLAKNNARQWGHSYLTRKEVVEEATRSFRFWVEPRLAADETFVFQNRENWVFVIASERLDNEAKPRGKCVLIVPEIASPETLDRAIGQLLDTQATCFRQSRFLPGFYHVGCAFSRATLNESTSADSSENEAFSYSSFAANRDRETGATLTPFSHVVFNLRARWLH